MNNWKKFTFFDKEIVKEQQNKAENEPSIHKLAISCTTSGRGSLIIGDAEGFIYFVDREFRNVSFQAYSHTILLVHQLKERNFLCSVGFDEASRGGAPAVLKIWNLDKSDKNDNPLCVRSIKLERPGIVTALAVLEDLSQIMVGLSNGEILAIRGDIFRDKTIKQKAIRKPDSPITGMGFLTKTSNTGPVLFVVTSTNVITYYTAHKDQENIIDDEGGEFGSFIISDDGTPIIARTNAIFYYTIDGRGPCFGFQGIKTKVLWFRSYLVVVGFENSTNVSNSFSFGSPSQSSSTKMNNILNIYDVKNKYVGFNERFDTVISHIASEWGSIFLFCADGKIYQLEEKDTQTKLETLFKKHSYQVAIDLAKSQHYDSAAIADVYRKYGDHLYSKGNYDGAITEYLNTIGQLEPSYVIRKFLDAQRIHNLTSYIQALHEKNLANANHTTLLLNCYTKLKDVKKLDHFIKTDSGTFDVETAIKVCRQAGYYEHALYLASKNNRHEWYLKILLEDLSEYRKALHYIQTLEWSEADKNLKRYGKTLVSEIPMETTDVLMKLCTNYQPLQITDIFNRPTEQNPSGAANPYAVATTNVPTPKKSAPEEFIHIFVSQTEWLVKFLEYMVKQNNDSPLVYNTLLELYLREDQQKQGPTSLANSTSSKAYEFLTNSTAKFDQDHALILAQVHNWKPGILYLYEKLELYNEIIEYHMENNYYDDLIKACKKYGDKDPNLWVRALSYFSITKQNCKNEITEVLVNIDKDNLIPPLLVIQILSQNQSTTLDVIKDYISRRLSQETQQINKDFTEIKRYADESEKMRTEITDLKSNAKIFQQTRCANCHNALGLPSIHFLCSHSFHQGCLGENERECVLCGPQNRRFLELKKNQSDSAANHDQFFKNLRTSPDGFTTISDYFGKAIIQ